MWLTSHFCLEICSNQQKRSGPIPRRSTTAPEFLVGPIASTTNCTLTGVVRAREKNHVEEESYAGAPQGKRAPVAPFRYRATPPRRVAAGENAPFGGETPSRRELQPPPRGCNPTATRAARPSSAITTKSSAMGTKRMGRSPPQAQSAKASGGGHAHTRLRSP